MKDLLVRYIADGNLDAIQALIKDDKSVVNTPINVTSSYTTYPLIYATQLGNEATVSLLLQTGANVHQTDEHDLAALDYAKNLHFKSIETCIIEYKKHHALQEEEFSRAVLSGNSNETQRYLKNFKSESSIMRKVVSDVFNKLKTEQAGEEQLCAVAFLLAKERGGLRDLIQPLVQTFDYDQSLHIGLGYLAKLYAMHQTHAFKMIIELGYPAINTIQLTLGRYPFNALQTALILYQDDDHHLDLVQTLLDRGHPLTFESNNWIKSLDALSLNDSDHQAQKDLVLNKKESFTKEFSYMSQLDSTEQFYKKLNSIDYALKLAFFVDSCRTPGLIDLLLKPNYTTPVQLAEIAGFLILSLQLKKRPPAKDYTSLIRKRTGVAPQEHPTLIASEGYTSPMEKRTRAETLKDGIFTHPHFTQGSETFQTTAYKILSYFVDSSASYTDDVKKEIMLNLKKKADAYLKDKEMDAALHCVTAFEILYKLIDNKTSEHYQMLCSSMVRKIILFKSISPQLGYEQLTHSFLTLSKLPKEISEDKNFQWVEQQMKGVLNDISSFTKCSYSTPLDFHQSTELHLNIDHHATSEKINHFFSYHLKKCTQLKSLSLSITLGTPDKWDSFNLFIKNLEHIATTLETFNLHIDVDDGDDYYYYNQRPDEYDEVMTMLSDKINDNMGCLSSNFTKFKALKEFSFQILPFLESVELGYATSQAVSEFFNTLPSDIMNQLTTLSLNLIHNQFSQEESAMLVRGLSQCTSLETLNINDANYFDLPAQAKLGRWIGEHKTIKKVHFSNDRGQSVTLDFLIYALNNQHLTDLVIKDFIFSDENTDVIFFKPGFKNKGYVSLEVLRESKPQYSIEDKIKTLGAKLKDHPSLEVFTFTDIYENLLVDRGFLTDHLFITDFLFPLLDNHKITTLRIDLNELVDRIISEGYFTDVIEKLQKRNPDYKDITWSDQIKRAEKVLTIEDTGIKLQFDNVKPNGQRRNYSKANYFYSSPADNLCLSRFAFLFSEQNIESFKKELIGANQDTRLNTIQLNYHGCSFNFIQMMILLYEQDDVHFPFFKILGPALLQLDFNASLSSYDEEREISVYQNIHKCKAALDQKRQAFNEETFELSELSFFEKMNFIDNALKLAIILHPYSAYRLITYLAENTTSLENLAESTVLFLDRSFSRTMFHGCPSSHQSQLIFDLRKLQTESVATLRQKKALMAKRSMSSSTTIEIKSSIFYHPHPNQHLDLDAETQTTAQHLFSIVTERCASKSADDFKNIMALLNKKSMNFLSKKDYDAASACSRSAQLIYSMIQNPTMEHHDLMIQACVNNILSLKEVAETLAEAAYAEGKAFLSALFTSLSEKERHAIETSVAYQFIYRTLPSEASIYTSEDFKRSSSTPCFFSPGKTDRETFTMSPVSCAITNSGAFAKRGSDHEYTDVDESEADDYVLLTFAGIL